MHPAAEILVWAGTVTVLLMLTGVATAVVVGVVRSIKERKR